MIDNKATEIVLVTLIERKLDISVSCVKSLHISYQRIPHKMTLSIYFFLVRLCQLPAS